MYVENMKLEISIKYIDLFYVDAKILSESRCKETLKGNIHQFLDNLSVLYNSKKPFVIRIPVIGDYTDGADNRKAIIQLLIKYRPIKVELIKEHSLGITKYTSLGLPIPMYKGVSDKLMEQYKKEIEEIGLPVEICKI